MGVHLPVRPKAYFYLAKKHINQLWGCPPFNSIRSKDEAKKEWSFTLTLLACLLGVHMDGLRYTHLVSTNSQATGVQRRTG
jgi:hypothetical protein